MKHLRPFSSMLLCLAACLGAAPALAHPVTVDGSAAEWFTREATSDNLGIIARNATNQGEYVWRDAAADTRTDLAATETIADLTRVRVTGNATGLSFLFVLASPTATTAVDPVQIQVAIDTNQVSGSGQVNLAGFADTTVPATAAWEYLVQTQFRIGTQARVLDTAFAAVGGPLPVGVASATATTVELTVPWARLGLSGPPTTPLRFTVATFRERSDGDVVAVGDSTVANALDAVSDYNAPRATAPYPNTFTEFTAAGDRTIGYSFDVYFGAGGEPYAPLQVTRYVSNGANTAAGGGDWIAVRNVTPAPLSLAGYRVTDEETAGLGEGAVSLPSGATLPTGGVFVVSTSGENYLARYGEAADGETSDTDATPNLTAYPTWATGSLNIANGGDEVIVLDRSHTAVDIVVYGGDGAYAGVVGMSAPAANVAASRNQATFADTDSALADFTTSTALCANDAACGGCGQCALNVCVVRAAGFTCRASAGDCDVAEVCDGAALGCPADGFRASSAVCRGSAGVCDAVENCTGTGAVCPVDGFAPSTTACRAAAGSCDVAESCTGSGASCPTDVLAPSTTVCRMSAGVCDAAENCTGDNGACPADGFLPSTTACRASTGVCDPGESCTGSAAACPGDVLSPVTTECRASAGPCDPAESCTGSTGACPADARATTATVCRASAGACDVAETCDGSAAACPADVLATTATVCRAAAGACDVAETCDGASTACPTNGFVASGTSCADTVRCNGEETCNGSGACAAGTPVTCAASGNPCATNACSESTGACALTNAAEGASCGDGNSCNGDETCDNAGACQMGTAPADGGPVCVDGSTDDVVDASDVVAADDVVDTDTGVADDVVATDDAGDVDAADAEPGDVADATDADVADAGAADVGGDVGTTDVGSVNTDSGVTTDVQTATDDGVVGTTPPGSEGCGCRTTGTGSSSRGAMGALLAIGAVMAMRRRRRS